MLTDMSVVVEILTNVYGLSCIECDVLLVANAEFQEQAGCGQIS